MWISHALGGLNANHVSYGVTPQMYTCLGDALFATLEACGDAWSSEAEHAWTRRTPRLSARSSVRHRR